MRRTRKVELQVLHSGGPCAPLAPDCRQIIFQPSFWLERAVILRRFRCELEIFKRQSLTDLATEAGCSTVFVFLVRVRGLARLAPCAGSVDLALRDDAAHIARLGVAAVGPRLRLSPRAAAVSSWRVIASSWRVVASSWRSCRLPLGSRSYVLWGSHGLERGSCHAQPKDRLSVDLCPRVIFWRLSGPQVRGGCKYSNRRCFGHHVAFCVHRHEGGLKISRGRVSRGLRYAPQARLMPGAHT